MSCPVKAAHPESMVTAAKAAVSMSDLFIAVSVAAAFEAAAFFSENPRERRAALKAAAEAFSCWENDSGNRRGVQTLMITNAT